MDLNNIFSDNEFVNELIKRKNSKRYKIIGKYMEQYELCISRIKVVSMNGRTDCFYTIPKIFFGFPEYNYEHCKNFIMDKLRKLYMDVSQYDDNVIFISWYYIELNREKKKHSLKQNH